MIQHARADKLMGPAPANRRTAPALELVTPVNKGKLHNYLIHAPFLSEAAMDACKRAKVNDEFEHIIDNTSVVLEKPDHIREVIRDIIKGREKNDMSGIRATVILSTTKDNNEY